MSYITVYCPAGQMYEVPPQKARTLIIDHGWTFTPKKNPDES